MKLIHTAHEIEAFVQEAKAAGKTIAFVPTMGALHDGHLSLVDIAKHKADVVVVSIFVNPKQFGANEDFDKYPRTLIEDAKLLETKNIDAIFAPSVEEVYPLEGVREQRAGVVGSTFEGASRPGHFDGMLTVVGRLFDLVQPDFAIFGAKDAQQVFMVKKLAGALYRDTEIVVAPTHREPSGLAMSSRNRYLTEAQKTSATALYKALKSLTQPLSLTLEAARTLIDSTPETKLDYIAVVDPEVFRPVTDDYRGKALAIVAASVGETRLIDNLELDLTEQSK
ncbi:MAG: pantoate--beta-alanine ligase [Rhodoluna sp.]|nr:pantoate--beta-alanine ligase [Rhodoluna sp.]